MKRMEKTGENLRREMRGAWNPLTIKMKEIERSHAGPNYLKYNWLDRQTRFLSSSKGSGNIVTLYGRIISLHRESI
jgi:hypothetical protein